MYRSSQLSSNIPVKLNHVPRCCVRELFACKMCRKEEDGLAVQVNADTLMMAVCWDGMQVGIIKSPLLTRTLFDVYLGQNPVSPDAKQSIGRGLVNLAIEDHE